MLYLLFFFCFSVYASNYGEYLFINTLTDYTKDKTINTALLESLATTPHELNKEVFNNHSAHLFSYFPGLVDTLPYISLGNFPTPIEKLEKLGNELHIPNLYIKRDDLCGACSGETHLFGGNKVRKLEFFLADALFHGARSVMTFGGVGSNHCTATAVCAQQLGLRCMCLLKDQPNSRCVQRNLLLMHSCGAQMHWFPSMTERNKNAASIFLETKKVYGNFPCVIPPGASLPVGTIGYVNAALELKEQINQGIIPVPDYIYLAIGSMGTTAGLLLGLKIAQLPTKVIAVNTDADEKHSDFVEGLTTLFYETNLLLHSKDNTIPLVELSPDEICILHNFCGKEYGAFTPECTKYIHDVHEKEHILLDGTYTAKAFAGMIHDIQQRKSYSATILFWNTWCSDSFEKTIKNVDYRELSPDFHYYFESPTQD